MRQMRLRRARTAAAAFVGVLVIALPILVACKGGSTGAGTTTTVGTTSIPTITQGGDIVVAAEGEPGCMDWISTCAGSAWGIWTVETNTMPRAYDFTADNQYKPSILLTGEATVQGAPNQVVTYRLNGRAVWSDGQPITSHDFEYTWDQVAHGQDIFGTAGYQDILSVDDSDPRTAVVTFSQPFANWRSLFGGPYGLLPSHLLEGQDRDALMKGGYTWSGGPWELAPGGWLKGQSIKLVPNPNYWGKRPDLASVTFRIFSDPSVELQAYAKGEVAAVYPAPELASSGYRNLPATSFGVSGGLDYEALWFDTTQAPVSDKAVRQAVAYALDRSAIASQLVVSANPADAGSPPIQTLLTPANGEFYGDAFAKYRPDLAAVTTLMQGDGWTTGADGIWVKGAKPAAIAVSVSAGSARDQQAAQLVATQLKTYGFAVTVTPEAPAAMLTSTLPTGRFQAALYPVDIRRQLATGVPAGAGINDNDPGQCRLFCSTAIPTTANGGVGANWTRVQDPTLDRYLTDLDTNLNDGARVADAGQAATILADLVPAVPLAALPDIVVVNTGRLAVEGGVFSHNLANGPYGYLNEWYLK